MCLIVADSVFSCLTESNRVHSCLFDLTQVCQKAWEVIYSVSHEKTLQLTREVKLGDITEPKRQAQETFAETKSDVVDYWMDLYFEKVADHMPDRNSIHLPTWMTQAWLHAEFLKDMESRPGGTVVICMLYLPGKGFVFMIFNTLYLQLPVIE